MILEYFKYLTNPASVAAKKLGQLQETIAMEARYKRSRQQWTPHLQNTQSLIEDTSRQIANPNEVVIMGSGLLLDIPIEFLAKYFKRVYLVDVVHLKSVKRAISLYNNVSTIEHDVTGLSNQLINPPTNINFKSQASIPCFSSSTSLVVSANMLSQLHYSSTRYAADKFNFNKAMQKNLALDIMSSHVSLLSNLPCKVCLITDRTRIFNDEKQQIIEREDALPGINLPKPDKEWFWEIAPRGELSKDVSLTSEVYGYQGFTKSL